MTDHFSPGWLMAGFLALAATDAAAAPFSMPKTDASMETCLSAALTRHAGKAVKLELKTERGVPIYEIEIAHAGKTMEFECDARSGTIIEAEEEVSDADDPRFRAKARLSLADAQKIALQRHPGKIVETEFEIEANGDASYEFDIETPDHRELKIEIDAATGKIVEDDEQEIYQIGEQ